MKVCKFLSIYDHKNSCICLIVTGDTPCFLTKTSFLGNSISQFGDIPISGFPGNKCIPLRCLDTLPAYLKQSPKTLCERASYYSFYRTSCRTF